MPDEERRKQIADYEYEVWRRGGNPDEVNPDDVPEDYDWVWDDVKI